MRNYPGLRASREAVKAARAQLLEAHYSPFMQFSFDGALGIAPTQQGTPIFSPETRQLPFDNPWRPVVATRIEGAVPLFTFGKLRGAWAAAQAGVEEAMASESKARAQLLADLRHAYFGLQMALDLQQLIREGKGKLEQAVSIMEEREASDDETINSFDKYRLASILAEVQARDAQALQAEHVAREALTILSGLEHFRVLDCPLAAVDYDTKALRDYRDDASEWRPDLKRLDAAKKAREGELRVHRGRYFPDLALALGVSYSLSPGITDQLNPFIYDRPNFTTFNTALVARWSLDFVGHVARHRRTQALVEQLKAQRAQAKDAIDLEVASTLEAVTAARAREEAWREGARQARSWFVAAGQGYQIGTLESKDLVDSIRAYFRARFEHLSALLAFNTALADLERVVGTRLMAIDAWEQPCYATDPK